MPELAALEVGLEMEADLKMDAGLEMEGLEADLDQASAEDHVLERGVSSRLKHLSPRNHRNHHKTQLILKDHRDSEKTKYCQIKDSYFLFTSCEVAKIPPTLPQSLNYVRYQRLLAIDFNTLLRDLHLDRSQNMTPAKPFSFEYFIFIRIHSASSNTIILLLLVTT